jgi:hypothetical protein
MSTSQDIFNALQRMGAGDFAHLNGSLESHLCGTEALLRSWGAPERVCRAGLFHAAYGTAGFTDALTSISLRSEVSNLIGQQAEHLVYLYCACDRQKFYPSIGSPSQDQMPDRFAGCIVKLDPEALSDLCEITAANELEIAKGSQSFRVQHGAALAELFDRMGNHLSVEARQNAAEVLAEQASSEALCGLTGGSTRTKMLRIFAG